MKYLLLPLSLGLLVSCNSGPPSVEQARANLEKTRQEAAKSIADAERELAEAIRRSESNIQGARQDLSQPGAQTTPAESRAPASEQ